MSASTLPTLDEVPTVPAGYGRDVPTFMRLLLIPRDDVDLRALAVKEFNLSERSSNEVALGGDETSKACQSMQLEKSHVQARTPGGIAWKISDVIDHLEFEIREGDGHYSWYYHLLVSAMSDALDLERKRQVACAADPLIDLARRCEESQAHIRHLEKTRQEDEPVAEREWTEALDRDKALNAEVRATSATSLAGVALKVIIAAMIKRISYPAGEEARFLDPEDFIILTAADDAKRLLGS